MKLHKNLIIVFFTIFPLLAHAQIVLKGYTLQIL